jgi:hypothetical protein
VALFPYDAHPERLIGHVALQYMSGGNALPTHHGSLEYLSVVAKCRLRSSEVPLTSTIHIIEVSQARKRIFSLRPQVSSQPAADMKKEMLERYAEDGYYFLEHYIDGMMETGRIEFY